MLADKQGFTLIELLVVIVIIGILAAAIGPRLMGLTGRAHEAEGEQLLRIIRTGMELYLIEYSTFPDEADLGVGGSLSTSGLLAQDALGRYVAFDEDPVDWSIAEGSFVEEQEYSLTIEHKHGVQSGPLTGSL